MKNNYISTTFLLIVLNCLASACQQAELPLTNAAKIEALVNWQDNSFCFSAKVQKSENVKVEEQGFVFMSPNFDHYDYWYEYNLKKETFVVPNEHTFEYELKRSCPTDFPCQVYAYVKTNYGNFRSEIVKVKTGNQIAPIITSVVHTKIDNGDWWNKEGTIEIEGSGFSDKPYAMSLWVDEGEKRMEFEIDSASFNYVKAFYKKGSWNKIGRFPLHLRVGPMTSMSEVYFEMKGTTLLSVDPPAFRYGDEITLHLKDFNASNNFQIHIINSWIDSSEQYKIVSVADNEVKLRIYPQEVDELSIRFYDGNSKYGPDIPVTLINAWQKVSSAEWKPEFDEYSNYYAYRNTGYVFDWASQSLKCYHPEKKCWDSLPFDSKEVPYADLSQFFAINNSLYMLVIYQKAMYDYSQALYRFNLDTQTWVRLKDAASNIDELLHGSFIVWDEHTVYSHPYGDFMYKYDVDKDIWVRNKVNLPYYIHFVGRYHEYIYYTDKQSFYRMKPEDPEKVEKVFSGEYFITNVKGAMMQGKYIYFQQGYGMFRLDVSASPAKLEPLGGHFPNYGMFFPLDGGIYYFNAGVMCQYLE